jgi:hypothetical protein
MAKYRPKLAVAKYAAASPAVRDAYFRTTACRFMMRLDHLFKYALSAASSAERSPSQSSYSRIHVSQSKA